MSNVSDPSNVEDLTAKILAKMQEDAQAFREEMRAFRDETRMQLAQLNHRVDALTLRVEKGFADVNVKFDHVNQRIDGVIEMFGRYYSDHEERIRRLEDRPPT